jgi:hypothetical protein
VHLAEALAEERRMDAVGIRRRRPAEHVQRERPGVSAVRDEAMDDPDRGDAPGPLELDRPDDRGRARIAMTCEDLAHLELGAAALVELADDLEDERVSEDDARVRLLLRRRLRHRP